MHVVYSAPASLEASQLVIPTQSTDDSNKATTVEKAKFLSEKIPNYRRDPGMKISDKSKRRDSAIQVHSTINTNFDGADLLDNGPLQNIPINGGE